MNPVIRLVSIDECYSKIETKFINELWNYDSLDTLDKDAHLILVKLLMEYILNRINNGTLNVESSISGYNLQLVEDKNRPYILFYYDKTKISLDKEILEYNSIESFMILFEKTINVCNSLSNYRILGLEFPFKLFSSIDLYNESKTEKEESLKYKIITHLISRPKSSLKSLKRRFQSYNIKLTKLQELKLLK